VAPSSPQNCLRRRRKLEVIAFQCFEGFFFVCWIHVLLVFKVRASRILSFEGSG
jgi:hypothetical protein